MALQRLHFISMCLPGLRPCCSIFWSNRPQPQQRISTHRMSGVLSGVTWPAGSMRPSKYKITIKHERSRTRNLLRVKMTVKSELHADGIISGHREFLQRTPVFFFG